MLHLLDANVLIDSARDFYQLDRVPQFWDWLLRQGEDGRIAIPREIWEEFKDGRDALGEWAFWGCMHYPACRGRLPACKKCGIGVLEPTHSGEEPGRYQCIHCKESMRRCPRCHIGALFEREGPHSRFLGCSEWRPDGRGCDYTAGLRVST